MSSKRYRTDANDDFATICQDATAGLNTNGIITLLHNPHCHKFEFDFQSLNLRWQICYALKFLKTHGWAPKNKRKALRTSYGWKHVVENQAKETQDGYYICNGVMILACRLAQISHKSINNDLNVEFFFGSDLDIENPESHLYLTSESKWKSKAAKKYASIALTCNLDQHFHNALIAMICQYLNIPFSEPPAFRNQARLCLNLLQPLSPKNQSSLL